jgi:sugar fermentation stimulation protein A
MSDIMNGTIIKSWRGLKPGIFLRRSNRFAGEVLVDGLKRYVHIPNPTTAKDLLKRGASTLVLPNPDGYKTGFRLIAVHTGKMWVSIDTTIPNDVFKLGVKSSLLHPFRGYRIVKENVRLGDSVIDFLLRKGEETVYVEVKSCSLVVRRVALFPDAVTVRGTRQLIDLEKASAAGAKTYMVWIIQRPDAIALEPNHRKDPRFAKEMAKAKQLGVRYLAYKCIFSGSFISLIGRVPVLIVPQDDPASQIA